MKNKRHNSILVITFLFVGYVLYDSHKESPYYHESFNGKIIKVIYNLGADGRTTFILDDSIERLPGGDVINYEIGDSVFKSKNTYNELYFRKDNNGKYQKLKIIQIENGGQKLIFNK